MSVQESILEMEAHLTASERNADQAALEALLSDAFMGVSIQGERLNKAQFIARLCNPVFRFTHLSIENLEVLDLKPSQVATGRSIFTAEVPGRTLQGNARFMDVWTQENGAWRLIASSVTPEFAPGS